MLIVEIIFGSPPLTKGIIFDLPGSSIKLIFLMSGLKRGVVLLIFNLDRLFLAIPFLGSKVIT